MPLLRPAILSALLLLFILGMSSFEVPRLIGRPARIDVFTTDIQGAISGAPPAFGVASALSLTLLAICILAVLFYRRATRHAEAFATITGKGYTPTRIRLGRWRWPVALGIGAVVRWLALGLPLLTLLWQSFFRNLAQPLFCVGPAIHAGQLPFHPELSDLPGGGEDERDVGGDGGDGRRRAHLRHGLDRAALGCRATAGMLDALAFMPIAIPSVIIGASVLFAYLMLPIPIYNTIWILLVAYVTIYLPYGMRFASGGIAQIHKELEEVAEVAGRADCTRYSGASCCRCWRLSCWRAGFTSSCWPCASSARRFSWSAPAPHVLGTISLTMWEEGGSYGAVAALGVIQIIPLIVIVAGLRFLELRVQRRTQQLGGQRRGTRLVSCRLKTAAPCPRVDADACVDGPASTCGHGAAAFAWRELRSGAAP